MIIIDFLFYFMALLSKNLDKKRVRHLNSAEAARNMIFISTFIWFLYINLIYNFIIFDKVYYSIPWYLTLVLSILLYETLTIIYIKRKRFQKIFEREQSSVAKFKISEKGGIIISSVYVFSGMVCLIVGMFIYHFMVYGI